MKSTLIYGLLILIGAGPAFAQSDTTRKAKLKVLPTAYYTPETRIAVEAFAYLSFNTKGAHRASNIRLFAAITQNRQLVVDMPWQIFTAGERYRVTGKWDLKKFPEYFYGIGNETREANRVLYTYRSTGIQNRWQKCMGSSSFLGLAAEARWLNAELPLASFGGMNDAMDVYGETGYRFVGVGPSFIHDSRDVILCPGDGQFLETTYLYNIGNAESKMLRYSKFIVDYRRYYSLPKQLVFAFQAVGQYTIGDVPYRELPALGGPLLHRGYYFGRFRDKNMVCAQAEARKHLFWRIGAAAFGSVGRVFHDFNSAVFNKYHPAAGGGLRFKLSKHDKANIRLDVAVTPDSHGFYVYFAEAF